MSEKIKYINKFSNSYLDEIKKQLQCLIEETDNINIEGIDDICSVTQDDISKLNYLFTNFYMFIEKNYESFSNKGKCTTAVMMNNIIYLVLYQKDFSLVSKYSKLYRKIINELYREFPDCIDIKAAYLLEMWQTGDIFFEMQMIYEAMDYYIMCIENIYKIYLSDKKNIILEFILSAKIKEIDHIVIYSYSNLREYSEIIYKYSKQLNHYNYYFDNPVVKFIHEGKLNLAFDLYCKWLEGCSLLINSKLENMDYRSDYEYLLSDIARIYKRKNDIDNFMLYINEAKDMSEYLMNKDPENQHYKCGYAIKLDSISQVLFEQDKFKDALEMKNEALAIHKYLAEMYLADNLKEMYYDHDLYISSYVDTMKEIAEIYKKTDENDKVKALYQEILNIRQRAIEFYEERRCRNYFGYNPLNANIKAYELEKNLITD